MRRPNALALMVALAGVVVSIVFASAMRAGETRNIQQRFELEARARVAAVRKSFDDVLSTLHAIRAFYRSSENVERDEVRALFEAGRADDGGYVFDQPMLLNLYRGAKA